MSAPPPTPSPWLVARDLTQVYPGGCALDHVAFDVVTGEVHALMGENGAGKSTLVRLLAGLGAPDAGEISIDGRPVRLRHPLDARRRGIAMIHQELLPFPDLTVAENIFAGCEPVCSRSPWVDRGRMRVEAARLLDRLGLDIVPTRRMGDLGIAARQGVEIAKALAHDVRLLIMDEPTSALAEREVERLFAVVRDLRGAGVSVVYVTHKLDEVFALADRITVLRDGRHVATRSAAVLDAAGLIELMVGRRVTPAASRASRSGREPILEVSGLTRSGAFDGVSLELGRGEILGITGLMGSGRTALLRALYGLAPAGAGTIRVEGRAVRIDSPRAALACGIAMVGEDRKETGLVLERPVTENVTLAALARVCRGPWIDRRGETRLVDGEIARLGIRVRSARQSVGELSGGNQQKVVLAQALLTRPRILLLDEPTRGIDVAAKAEIHAQIRQLAEQGMSIILVSSELPEVLSLSDRLLVMRSGRIVAQLEGPALAAADVLGQALGA